MWIIKDWAGIRKFPDHEFNTFDDAMEVLDREIEKEMLADGIKPYTYNGDEAEEFGDYRGEYEIEEI